MSTYLPKNLDQTNRVFAWFDQVNPPGDYRVKGGKQASVTRLSDRLVEAQIIVELAIISAGLASL